MLNLNDFQGEKSLSNYGVTHNVVVHRLKLVIVNICLLNVVLLTVVYFMLNAFKC